MYLTIYHSVYLYVITINNLQFSVIFVFCSVNFLWFGFWFRQKKQSYFYLELFVLRLSPEEFLWFLWALLDPCALTRGWGSGCQSWVSTKMEEPVGLKLADHPWMSCPRENTFTLTEHELNSIKLPFYQIKTKIKIFIQILFCFVYYSAKFPA